MENDSIVTIASKKDEKFLRAKTHPFEIAASGKIFRAHDREYSRRELHELIRRMQRAMTKAQGIGLSANQVGLPYRLFVARIADEQGNYKSYALLNPVVEKYGTDTALLEEGCLSVPKKYGHVNRSKHVAVRGYDKNGKIIRIKAWGLLAHVFQHEIDHLEGRLFIDTAKDVYETPSSERLQKKETRQ